MTLAILSFILSWIVLAFFVSLLLNIIDAVYICFAMDRDMQVSDIDLDLSASGTLYPSPLSPAPLTRLPLPLPFPPPPAGLHPPRGAQRVLVVAVLRGTRRSEPRRSLCLRRPKRTCDEADGPIALLRKGVSASQNTPSAWWHSRWSYNETQVTGGTGTTGPLHAQHPLLWVHTTVPVPYVEHTTGRMRRPQGE